MDPRFSPADGEVIEWSFGFGSNMNVEFVEKKKQIPVAEHTCARLSGWRLAFNTPGLDDVEPSFGNAMPPAEGVEGVPEGGGGGDELHGVALRLSPESMDKMDRMEGVPADWATNTQRTRGYRKAAVTVRAYDGRTLRAWVFTSIAPRPEDVPCSKRYLNVLVSGAREAGLSAEYIESLSSRRCFNPIEETMALRARMPPLAALTGMTVEELASTKADGSLANAEGVGYVCVLGYVLRIPRAKVLFSAHLGRDITTRQSRHFRGISMDADDDGGKPPFRTPAVMGGDGSEAEYVHQWLDHYLVKGGVEAIVAALVEYREQVQSESTASAT
mmetsp:Transcript_115736/g.360479  ORF Transcript_115736/g.360479 Transcript_115736/m.360479 type:complete len:330 (-) Transcript_115736:129-1118(-)